MAKIWRSQSWRADRMITVKMVIYQGRRRYWRRSHQFRISLACWRAGRRNSGLEYKANAKHGFLALFSNHYYFGLVSILLLVWFENLWNLCGRVTFSQAAVVAFFNSLAEGGMQASIMVQKLSPSLWCISNIKKKTGMREFLLPTWMICAMQYYLKARFHFSKNHYADLMLLLGIAGMASQVCIYKTMCFLNISFLLQSIFKTILYISYLSPVLIILLNFTAGFHALVGTTCSRGKTAGNRAFRGHRRCKSFSLNKLVCVYSC